MGKGIDTSNTNSEYWEKILRDGLTDSDAGRIRILSAQQEDNVPLVRGAQRDQRHRSEIEHSTGLGNGAQAIEEGVDVRYGKYAEEFGFDYEGTSTPTSFENLVKTINSIVGREKGSLRKVTAHPSCEETADRADSINLVFDNGRVYNISTASLSDYDTSNDDYYDLQEDSRQAFRDRLSKWIEQRYSLELEEFSDE